MFAAIAGEPVGQLRFSQKRAQGLPTAAVPLYAAVGHGVVECLDEGHHCVCSGSEHRQLVGTAVATLESDAAAVEDVTMARPAASRDGRCTPLL